jgi:hypothetical protein
MLACSITMVACTLPSAAPRSTRQEPPAVGDAAAAADGALNPAAEWDAHDSAAADAARMPSDGAPTAAVPDGTQASVDGNGPGTDAAAGGAEAGDSAVAGDAASAGGYDPQQPPQAIPAVPEDPPQPCVKAQQVKDYFQFLDDLCDAKPVPSWPERGLACPVVDTLAQVPLLGGGTASYLPYDQPQAIDDKALQGLLPPDMAMTVVAIKRIAGTPHLRILGGGGYAEGVQPWSSTKWLAAANAASQMRILSGYKVGLTAMVKGYSVGDLVSSMHAYDNQPYSSNGLGRWFHDIGGRQRANDLIHDLWLQRPASETFGGNYGSASPPLGYQFSEASGATLTVTPDQTAGPANKLSMLTLAMALQRVVLHREQPKTRLPGLQWQDIEVLLHGAKTSAAYGDWGGMSADTAIYLQSAHDWSWIEQRSQGRWRVHGKLGLGTKYQFVWVGYACLPWLDGQGQPIANWGREVVFAVHLPTGGADWAARDRLLAQGVRKVLTRLVDGRL